MPILLILVESASLQLVVELILLILYSINYNAQYILLEIVTPLVVRLPRPCAPCDSFSDYFLSFTFFHLTCRSRDATGYNVHCHYHSYHAPHVWGSRWKPQTIPFQQ